MKRLIATSHLRTVVSAGVILLLAMLASGCADTASQSEVVVSPSVTSVTASDTAGAALTPLQRGRVRRAVLSQARPALEAWKAGNTDAMKKYFAPDLVERVQEWVDKDEAQGRRHVREHTLLFLDVIDMTQDGNQAVIDYQFKDNSYAVALDDDGTRLTEPTGKETSFQMTWQREDGRWQLIRVIGASDALR